MRVGEAAARQKGVYCDSEMNEIGSTYELSAWYEPLLMIDLMKIKLKMSMGFDMDEIVDGLIVVDDDYGWMKREL